jgi:hypothetical protein
VLSAQRVLQPRRRPVHAGGHRGGRHRQPRPASTSGA